MTKNLFQPLFSFVTNLLNTKAAICRKQKALNHIAFSTFEGSHIVKKFKGKPVMIIENNLITQKSGDAALSLNVYFFENGQPTFSYKGVTCDFDTNATASDIQQLINESKEWATRTITTWNKEGLLDEYELSIPKGVIDISKYYYGENQQLIKRINANSVYGNDSATYKHLPKGEGYYFHYDKDVSSGEKLSAWIVNDQVVIRRKQVASGRVEKDFRYYLNHENRLTRLDILVNGRIWRRINFTLNSHGDIACTNDELMGSCKMMYRYDNNGNYLYSRMEHDKGMVYETNRKFRYTKW